MFGSNIKNVFTKEELPKDQKNRKNQKNRKDHNSIVKDLLSSSFKYHLFATLNRYRKDQATTASLVDRIESVVPMIDYVLGHHDNGI